MSKKKKILISVLLVVVVIICIISGVYCFASSSIGDWIYYRTYQGDRINVSMQITVDGHELSQNDVSVHTADYDYNKEDYSHGGAIKCNYKEDGNITFSFSQKADGYGDYHYFLTIDDRIFVLDAYQWNWWDLQNIELYLDIDTKKGEYTVSQEYSYIRENGYFETAEVKADIPPETFDLTDNHIWIGMS